MHVGQTSGSLLALESWDGFWESVREETYRNRYQMSVLIPDEAFRERSFLFKVRIVTLNFKSAAKMVLFGNFAASKDLLKKIIRNRPYVRDGRRLLRIKISRSEISWFSTWTMKKENIGLKLKELESGFLVFFILLASGIALFNLKFKPLFICSINVSYMFF